MRYYPFSRYLKQKYGTKVRKIGLNANFPCPNRSGGDKGCIFCNEQAFSRYAGTRKPLDVQLAESLKWGRSKWGDVKFMAYFQNSTSTNASIEDLKKAIDAVNDHEDIVAVSLSTRPDCIDKAKLDLIESYLPGKGVWIEYGLQSSWDESLDWMRRGHTYGQAEEAIRLTAERNINVGAHVILGVPNESIEDMTETARRISSLPVRGVKLHILHVLKGTHLETLYKAGKAHLLSREEYVSAACSFIEELPPDCVILRLVSDAEREYLVAPGWMNDKMSTIKMIEKEFKKRGTRQGSAYLKRKGLQ